MAYALQLYYHMRVFVYVVKISEFLALSSINDINEFYSEIKSSFNHSHMSTKK